MPPGGSICGLGLLSAYTYGQPYLLPFSIWFSSSGGSLSPNPSMPLSMPQSSPVFGCQPHPTVSRNPDANTDRLLPSSVARNIVAFSGLGSAHSLHVDPTEMYSMSSGPICTVRVLCCPASGKS